MDLEGIGYELMSFFDTLILHPNTVSSGELSMSKQVRTLMNIRKKIAK